jgi:uncharacterized protein YraI
MEKWQVKGESYVVDYCYTRICFCHGRYSGKAIWYFGKETPGRHGGHVK